MVWVRDGDRRYHLAATCPLLVDAERNGEDRPARDEREAQARRRGLVRCHVCYGSAGRTA